MVAAVGGKPPSSPSTPAEPTPPEPASKSDIWLPRILAAFAAVPAVLGVIKTFLEAGTGNPFTVGDAAYYVGWAALGAYSGFFVSWLAGLVNVILVQGFGVEEEDIEALIVGLAGVLWLGTVVLFVAIADPPEEGAGFFRVLGVLTVLGAALGYAAYSGSKRPA